MNTRNMTAAEMPANMTIDCMKQQDGNSHKNYYQRCLCNTRFLLQNYRGLKIFAEESLSGAEQSENRPAGQPGDDVIQTDVISFDDVKISQQDTISFMNHMDKMLDFYRMSCEQSGKRATMRRYRAMRAMYIDIPKLTARQIAQREYLDERAVYRDLEIATKQLCVLFYGINGMTFGEK